MRRLFLIAASLLALAPSARAADSTVAAMTDASALGGTELFYVVQGGADRKATPAQINTYVRSLMGTGVSTWLNTPSSANLAAAVTDETGSGALVFATSPTLVTPILGTPTSGTLTNTTGFPLANLAGAGTGVLGAAAATLNAATGLVGALTPTNSNCIVGNGSAWTSTTCPGGGSGVSSIAGNTGAFTLNATSGITNSTNDIICSQGSASQFGCVKADNTTITAASGVLSAAPTTATPSLQTGTNYAFQSTDRAKVIYLSNGSNQVPTIAQATGSFGSGWFTTACNINTGTQTITPTTSTIGGAATYVLPAGTAAAPSCISIVSDGTNYLLVPNITTNASLLTSGTLAAARGGAGTITGALRGNGSGTVTQAACADLSNGTALCSTTPGTNVATAAAVTLSAAGGLSSTIASGTSALGTSAISSATCATVVTTSATNTATTDVIWWGFNGDPTAVTGYVPLTSGMLTIIAYPSANNVNFKVCNNTNGSITPGAITLNWRVIR